MFNYNPQQAQESASSAGGDYITQSGVYRCKITKADWTTAQNSQAAFLEIGVESETGQKSDYLSICHTKKDGSPNDYGVGQIQQIMGVTGAQNLTNVNGKCPELIGRPVSLALERENFIKQSGAKAGQPGFKFDIKCIMSAKSGQTIAEHAQGKPAESAKYWADRFAKEPDGKPIAGGQQSAPVNMLYSQPAAGMPPAQAPVNDIDDEIPF